MNLKTSTCLLSLCFAAAFCAAQPPLAAAPNGLSSADSAALFRLSLQYQNGWLAGDSAAVLACFEKDARLAPSGACPVSGMGSIRNFWFPNDSSQTVIHGFDNRIVELSGEGDMAFATQKTWLDWSYFKGNYRMGKEQRGYATTVFRRQKSGDWKIWRQAWTDVWSRTKPDAEVGKPAPRPEKWPADASLARAAEAEKNIRAAAAAFSTLLTRADWDAVAAAYTPDARIFPPGQPIAQGRAEIRKIWAGSPKITFHKVTPSEIKITGSEAWDWGVYEGKSIGADGKESVWKGKYVIVWREVSPGDWRIHLDIWNRQPD